MLFIWPVVHHFLIQQSNRIFKSQNELIKDSCPIESICMAMHCWNIQRCRSCGQKRGPLPVIILGIQQEVSAHDCHADRDNHQNEEDQQHESVDIVHLRRKLILRAS